MNNFDASSLSSDDEIDLREVAAAFQRHRFWVVSGGLLGLVIAVIPILKPAPLQETLKLVVDTSQGPCEWTKRKFKQFQTKEVFNIACSGEFMTARKELDMLAADTFRPPESPSAKVQPLNLGSKKDGNLTSSTTQLEVLVTVDADNSEAINTKLERLKTRFMDNRLRNTQSLSTDIQVGEGWIQIEKGPDIKDISKFKSSSISLALGLFGGLALGSGAALVADGKSDRVFGKSKLLGKLGYPLWLTLPKPPWPDQLTSPLIGQLAARLDRSCEWRVLSIAHEHEAVSPLAEALIRQNEPELSCKSVEPLLNSIVRLGSNARPIGLLVVVESGFNSSQALEDARLLLRQLPFVQSIGVVLVGVPLPSELTAREKT